MLNVASTCCRFWQHVERFFHPFDISKQIEHVQFLSTCRTNEQKVAVKEAGVDDVLPFLATCQMI